MLPTSRASPTGPMPGMGNWGSGLQLGSPSLWTQSQSIGQQARESKLNGHEPQGGLVGWVPGQRTSVVPVTAQKTQASPAPPLHPVPR